MKRLILIVAAVGLAALVLLRPVPPPAPAAGAWSSAMPQPAPARGKWTPPSRALVYVAGDVMHPGVYAIGQDARVRDALALAGGSHADADPVAVNLAAHIADGDEIVVPVRGEALPPRARARGHGRRSAGSHRARGHRHTRADVPPPAGQIDINAADADTLATIPGIGPGLAERIVAFRAANGPFASVDELLDVSGITEHRLDAIVPYAVAR